VCKRKAALQTWPPEQLPLRYEMSTVHFLLVRNGYVGDSLYPNSRQITNSLVAFSGTADGFGACWVSDSRRTFDRGAPSQDGSRRQAARHMASALSDQGSDGMIWDAPVKHGFVRAFTYPRTVVLGA